MVYVFPLPETAAVDALSMVVGDRVIEGEIRPAEEAVEVYRKAAKEGREAALLEETVTSRVLRLGMRLSWR